MSYNGTVLIGQLAMSINMIDTGMLQVGVYLNPRNGPRL